MTRPIFLLTDFGQSDIYVGVVKAVILGIAPDARIVDLTHEVPPQDIRAGAYALMTAAPYLPADAVVLAVVDPGVGTARRPIAVQVEACTLVGPDNGLLSWAAGVAITPRPPAGLPHPGPLPGGEGRGEGRYSAVVLDRPRFWLPTVSATFHGRDLFGPVAAQLARGVTLAEVGSPTEAIQQLPFPLVQRTRDTSGRLIAARGEAIHIDRFGNLISNLGAADLPADPVVSVAGRRIVGLSPHFQPSEASSEGQRPIALIGSAGLLEIAVPNGSAATELGAGVGTAVAVAAS
jgi:S-adenosylmethionine hydrolase